MSSRAFKSAGADSGNASLKRRRLSRDIAWQYPAPMALGAARKRQPSFSESSGRAETSADRLAVRLDYQPDASELVDVLAEDVAGRVLGVVVERVAGVGDLAHAVVP